MTSSTHVRHSSLRALLERLARVDRHVAAAAQRYGMSRLALGLRLYVLQKTQGFRPVEALELGLANPAVPTATLAGCIVKKELLAIQDRLNPPALTCLTEDKSIFYPLCEAYGIPVPQTYAIVSQGTGWLRGGRPLSGREASIEALSQALPTTFICKPSSGVYGEDVTAWTRVGDGLVDHDSRHLTFAQFYDALGSNPRYDRFVVQERLSNHPEILRLTATTGLQTLRLVTLVDSDGQIHMTDGALKLILGDQVIDNLRHGTTGNIFAPLGILRGQLTEAMAPSPDGVGWVCLRKHPVTGLELPGFQLPDWTATLDLVARCARLFLPLRTIGWDIALTPRGPIVIEANRWWDPPNDMLLSPALDEAQRREMIAVSALLRQLARTGN
jgi:hypothetical protein